MRAAKSTLDTAYERAHDKVQATRSSLAAAVRARRKNGNEGDLPEDVKKLYRRLVPFSAQLRGQASWLKYWRARLFALVSNSFIEKKHVLRWFVTFAPADYHNTEFFNLACANSLEEAAERKKAQETYRTSSPRRSLARSSCSAMPLFLDETKSALATHHCPE